MMPRARRIVLHPGFHRTGCRSIQQFLAINDAALSHSVRSLMIEGVRPIVRLGRIDAAAGRAAMARAVGLVFPDTADADTRDIVISAEALCGAPAGRPETLDYNTSPASVAEIANALSDRFPDAEVIVALTARDAEDWLFTAYKALLRHTRLRLGRAAFAACHRRATEFDRLAQETAALISQTGGTATVRLLWLEQIAEHPLGPGGAVIDLLDPPDALRAALSPSPYADHDLPTPFWHMFLAINRSKTSDKDARAAKDDIIETRRRDLSKMQTSG